MPWRHVNRLESGVLAGSYRPISSQDELIDASIASHKETQSLMQAKYLPFLVKRPAHRVSEGDRKSGTAVPLDRHSIF